MLTLQSPMHSKNNFKNWSLTAIADCLFIDDRIFNWRPDFELNDQSYLFHPHPQVGGNKCIHLKAWNDYLTFAIFLGNLWFAYFLFGVIYDTIVVCSEISEFNMFNKMFSTTLSFLTSVVFLHDRTYFERALQAPCGYVGK